MVPPKIYLSKQQLKNKTHAQRISFFKDDENLIFDGNCSASEIFDEFVNKKKYEKLIHGLNLSNEENLATVWEKCWLIASEENHNNAFYTENVNDEGIINIDAQTKSWSTAFEEYNKESNDIHIDEQTKTIITHNANLREVFSIKQDFLELFNMKSFENEIIGECLFYSFVMVLLRKRDVMIELNNSIEDMKIMPISFFCISESGCLSEDTKIATPNKDEEIKNLPEFFKVWSHNFATGINEWKTAKKIDTGEKEVFEIRLGKYGNKKILVTEDHKLFVNNDGIKEVLVKDLKIGDNLLCTSTKCLPNNNLMNPNLRETRVCKNKICNTKFVVYKKSKQMYCSKKCSDTSEERRQKLSESKKKLFASGYICPLRGRKNPFFTNYNKARKGTKLVGTHYTNVINAGINTLRKYNETKNKLPWEEKWGKETADRARKKASIANTGEKNNSYGKVYYPSRIFIPELSIKVKSSYERECALKLKENNITFLYEPEMFRLSNTTYTPDFKINDGVFLETKGYLTDKYAIKYKEFIEKYHKRLIFLTKGKEVYNLILNYGFEVYNMEFDNWIEVVKNANK